MGGPLLDERIRVGSDHLFDEARGESQQVAESLWVLSFDCNVLMTVWVNGQLHMHADRAV